MHEHGVHRAPIRQSRALARELAPERAPLSPLAIGPFSGGEPRLPVLAMTPVSKGTIAAAG